MTFKHAALVQVNAALPPDALECVLDVCDARTLSTLARTCQIIGNSAIRHLYRDISLGKYTLRKGLALGRALRPAGVAARYGIQIRSIDFTGRGDFSHWLYHFPDVIEGDELGDQGEPDNDGEGRDDDEDEHHEYGSGDGGNGENDGKGEDSGSKMENADEEDASQFDVEDDSEAAESSDPEFDSRLDNDEVDGDLSTSLTDLQPIPSLEAVAVNCFAPFKKGVPTRHFLPLYSLLFVLYRLAPQVRHLDVVGASTELDDRPLEWSDSLKRIALHACDINNLPHRQDIVRLRSLLVRPESIIPVTPEVTRAITTHIHLVHLSIIHRSTDSTSVPHHTLSSMNLEASVFLQSLPNLEYLHLGFKSLGEQFYTTPHQNLSCVHLEGLEVSGMDSLVTSLRSQVWPALKVVRIVTVEPGKRILVIPKWIPKMTLDKEALKRALSGITDGAAAVGLGVLTTPPVHCSESLRRRCWMWSSLGSEWRDPFESSAHFRYL